MWNATTEERFWAKVARGADDECWLWRGSLGTDGCPQFWCGNPRRMRRASRWIYEHVHGPIPEGLFVCHKCDVPRCVNPAHLWAGTHRENVEDAMRKGRMGGLGPIPKNAKLTEDAVRVIRQLYAEGATQRALGATYGVSSVSINHAIHGKTWRRVPQPS